MMVEIKVTYDSHMGDCLKVCRMAKDSFGRTTDWEETRWIDCSDKVPKGFIVTGNHGDFDLIEVARLSEKDQRLLKMLARGMGQSEYGNLVMDIVHAGDCDNVEEVERLMWKFRNTTPHLAPFGHNFVTFKFQAPVFVMRQIVKHEYIRISELSMRYVRDMPEYFRPKSWRSVADDVKQGSGGGISGVPSHMLYKHMDDCAEYDADEYRDFTNKDGKYKLAPEQARMFLRLCHMTQGHLSGSMDAIAGLVTKRLDPHAQAETREFAIQIDNIMFDLYPWSWAALTEGVARD